VIPSSGRQLTLGAASAINPNGVITLGDAGNGFSILCCAGVTLTNSGHLDTVAGAGGNRYLRANLTNAAAGTVNIGGTTLQDGGGGGSTTTINNGAITVAASGSLTLGGFTNPETFSNSGGSITNNGAITMRNLATFIQRGGSETGIPVALNSGSTLDDDVSAAAAGFVIPESDATLTGSGSNPGLAAGQVLTVAANYTQATLGKSLTNAGTLILGDAGSGFSILCCAGVTLTNTGHLNTLAGAGGNRHLRANIINAGGLVDIAGPTLQDGGGGGATSIANNRGTVMIEPGQSLALSGGSSFSQQSTATFATAIDANTTAFGQLSGGAVSLNGQLKVTTVGSPPLDSQWPLIAGATRAGMFATLDFRGEPYRVQYSAGGVTLIRTARVDRCVRLPKAWECHPMLHPPSSTPGVPWWKRPPTV